MMYRYGSGTRTATVDLSVTVQQTILTHIPHPPEHPAHEHQPASTIATYAIGAEGASVVVTGARRIKKTDGTVETEAEYFDGPHQLEVGVRVLLSGYGQSSYADFWVGSVDVPANSQGTASGSWTGTLVVNEPEINCIEITGAALSIIDAPFPLAVQLLQKGDQSQTASATCAGLSVSGPPPVSPSYAVSATIVAGAQDGGSGSWSAAPVGDYYAPPVSLGAGDAGGSLSASPGNLSVSGASDYAAQGTCDTQWFLHKRFALSGVVRAMEAAYPDALKGICSKFAGDTDTEFDITDGAFSVGYAQRRGQFGAAYTNFNLIYDMQGDENGKSTSFGINEWQPISCVIKSDSLAAVGDDPRATRLLMRGKTFGGIGLNHAASTLIDDCSTLTKTGNWAGAWQAVGGGAAPSIAGGGIAFSGSVRRGFTHDVSLSGYRHLNVRAKSAVANAPLTVSIGGKSWSGKTGAADTFTDIKLDLCGEQNQSATTSTWDTKWPLLQNDDLTRDDLPVSEGAYFGVGRCASITISGASGTAFVVSRVELVRDAAPLITYMPAFYNGKIVPSGDGYIVDAPWPVSEYPDRAFGTGGEGTSSYYARRFLLASVDGRQGMEEKDSSYIYSSPPSGNSSVSPSQVSIKNLVDSINSANSNGALLNPGWSATSSKPAPTSGCDVTLPDFDACYLNENLPAVFLQGGGALAKADGAWEYGFDKSDLGALAQMLFDSIEWFPAAGDFFGFGGNPASGPGAGTIQLRVAAILRGAMHGLALSTSKQPAADKVVELRQGTPAPGLVVSSGTSAANGFYITHDGPFARTVLAALAKSGNLSVSFTAFGRKRQRVVFVAAKQAFYGPIAIDSPRQYLHVADGKQIKTYHLANVQPAFESDEHPVVAWSHLCCDERHGAALFALGQTGETTFSLYRSRDGGRSLLEIVTMTAKTAALEKDSERKWLILVFSDASGAVYRRVCKDGTNWEAAESVGLTGAVLDLCQDARAAGLLLLTLQNAAGDAAQVLKSSDGGLHWITLLA